MSQGKILITGSAGLIGTALCAALTASGYAVRTFDIRDDEREDILTADLSTWLSDCVGVVHLAALSRVIWGEQDPVRCIAINQGGVERLLAAVKSSAHRPWVLFASSREVYGHPAENPVRESAPLVAANIYGHTKIAGERAMIAARTLGLRTGIVRLSNVFGSRADHATRVVPAFAKAALEGRDLLVEGSGHTFDFTHVSEVARGLVRLVELLQSATSNLPAVHLVGGVPTTLGQLAQLCVDLSGRSVKSKIIEKPSRTFDVAHFWGDPTRAKSLLGWEHQLTLEQGLRLFMQELSEPCH